MAVITTGQGLQNSSSSLLMQMKGTNGELVTQADVSTITYEVWDISNPASPIERIDSTSLTIGDVIFDTPVNDDRWTQDEIGYNFALKLPVTAFPNAVDHRIDVLVSWSNGDPEIIYPFNVQALASYHDA